MASNENNNTKTCESQSKKEKTLSVIHERMKYKQELLSLMKKVLPEKTYVRYAVCGLYLVFDNAENLVNANFCKHRMCPVCNNRKSIKNYAENIQLVKYLQTDYRFLFFTATVRNCTGENLSKTIDEMNVGFHRYANGSLFKKHSCGYFKSLEITYNPNENTYHPHFHWICAVKPQYFDEMPSTYEWRKAWERSLKLDYNCQFDIKAVKESETEKAVAEISKYTLKLSSVLDVPDDTRRAQAVRTILKAVHKRRLVNTAGVFRTACAALGIDPNDDEVLNNQLEENVYFFDSQKYRKGTKEQLFKLLYD